MLTKNDVIQGVGQVGKNDIIWGQANNTGMPSKQKSEQSGATNLSLKYIVVNELFLPCINPK